MNVELLFANTFFEGTFSPQPNTAYYYIGGKSDWYNKSDIIAQIERIIERSKKEGFIPAGSKYGNILHIAYSSSALLTIGESDYKIDDVKRKQLMQHGINYLRRVMIGGDLALQICDTKYFDSDGKMRTFLAKHPSKYNVSGIDCVVWKFAKSDKCNSESNIEQLKGIITDYCGSSEINDLDVVKVLVSTYSEYCANVKIPRHLTRDFLMSIHGNSLLEMVYGKDDRSIGEKIVDGILGVLRMSQMRDDKGNVLIDYGQCSEEHKKDD